MTEKLLTGTLSLNTTKIYAFVWKIVKTIDFSETIVIYGYKLVDAVNLNEYMKLYE